MKLLWQNKFDGFDLVRTSPLYYKATVEKEERVLNCYFFDRGVGIKSLSFETQTGQILTYSKDGKSKRNIVQTITIHTICHVMILFLENTPSLIMASGGMRVRKMINYYGKNP